MDAGPFALPAGATTLLAGGVPAGTYYVRLRQRGLFYEGAPSHEAVVTVPGSCEVPVAPRALRATRQGNVVTLTWAPALVGTAAPSSWLLLAGTASGASDLGSLPVPGRQFTALVPAGTYFVRVAAVNGCGVSGPSDEVTVTVP